MKALLIAVLMTTLSMPAYSQEQGGLVCVSQSAHILNNTSNAYNDSFGTGFCYDSWGNAYVERDTADGSTISVFRSGTVGAQRITDFIHRTIQSSPDTYEVGTPDKITTYPVSNDLLDWKD